MRVYLDICCYNRPYDDQSQRKISDETKAKLRIQDLIRNSLLDLVDSYMLRYECEQNPIYMRRTTIMDFISANAKFFVGEKSHREIIVDKAHEIMLSGLKFKDSCHVASAIFAECDYLITTDKRLLKYKSDRINLVSPIEFLRILEDI